MLFKINDKYYVKVSDFYQELEVVDGNLKPINGEKHRIYAPVSNAQKVLAKDILENTKGEKIKNKLRIQEEKKNRNIDIL